MKTHFAEEIDDASPFNETAEEHVWHEHRLTPGSAFGNIAAVGLLAAAFVILLKLSLPATQPVATLGLSDATPASIAQDATSRTSGREPGDERERVR
jgi:hypothetical protein